MSDTPFKVEFFELRDGKCPALSFISSLNVKIKAKVFRDLSLLEKNGNKLGMPFSKFLEEGIFELRSKLGSTTVRLFYFFEKGKIIIITNGFTKKTQKTPSKELVLAKKYREDYLARKHIK